VVYATALYLIVAILCYIKMAKEIELAFGTEAFLDILHHWIPHRKGHKLSWQLIYLK